MRVLVLDTIHGGATLAEALVRYGDEVVAVDVYRGGVPTVSEVEDDNYDVITAPVHLDADFPLLHTKVPVITHHEMTARLAEDYQVKLIEITGARGKTTTAFAVASILSGRGILHTSAGTFLYPEKELLFRKSITPASLLFALDAASKMGAEWVVAEESIGVSGAGCLGILTSENTYRIASGKKDALSEKMTCLNRCRHTLLPEDVRKLVSVHDNCIVSPAGSFENPLIEIPVYRAALQTAAAAASILGVSVKPLEQFSAVPGRMQLLEEDGVFVLDNSNSGTTVENTLEAAAYLQQVAGKPVILVVGEGAHAVCEGLTGRDSIPEKDFAAVIPAEGRVFDELKNEAVSLAKERDASVLLAVKTWR